MGTLLQNYRTARAIGQTLAAWLASNPDASVYRDADGGCQVFVSSASSAGLFRLRDYRVTASLSGPSYWLSPTGPASD